MSVKECVFLLIIVICAFQDFIQKKISLIWIVMGMMFGIGLIVCEYVNGKSFRISDIFYLIPGVLLIVIACVSSQVGLGDGLTVLMLGLYYPSSLSILILVLAFFFLYIFTLCSFVLGKTRKNTQIPFAPFLLFGTIGGLLIYA